MTRIKAGVGIDLGSSAVRVGVYRLDDDCVIGCVKEEVSFYHHEDSCPWEYTQSTNEITTAIEKCFTKLSIENYDIRSCGVSATCSLAIFAKVADQLVPFGGLRADNEQNVVFWMDSTPKEECQLLNDLCDQPIKDVMGGGFIPEMAIPKVLRMRNHFSAEGHLDDKTIVVMDLHRYIAYQIAQSHNWNFEKLINTPNANGVGHDGELSGWSTDFYKNFLRLPSSILIGPETDLKSSETKSVKVASCIDCYSSWLSLCSSDLMSSLFIVGGTSTCFLKATKGQQTIPGAWGPFTNILDDCDKFGLYEGGQSCTGRLIEHLITTHPASSSITKDQWPSLLDRIEDTIVEMEEKYECSIHMKTKHMFYYGDLQGNRTPFADPAMSGSFIGETTDISWTNLVYRYVCILEFLAFQIKYMIAMFNNADKATKIKELRICGSQARNKRLLSLIHLINNNIPIKLPTANVDLSGASGAYLLGKCALLGESVIQMIEEKQAETGVKDFKADIQTDKRLLKLLETKFTIHLDMAKQQIEYRRAVDKALEVE